MAHRLITHVYESGSNARNGEMELALEINAGAFDEITVVAQSMPRLPTFRGTWIAVTHQQRAVDLFSAARMSIPSDLVVISHGDIAFTKHTLQMLDENITHEDAFCLSRWDLTSQGIRLFNRLDSQDTWAFRGVPRITGGQYAMSVPGCDNRLAHDLHAAGYKVSNPAKDIRTYHLHLSALRPSNKPELRVPPPYLHIRPARLGEPPELSVPKIPSTGASAFQ